MGQINVNPPCDAPKGLMNLHLNSELMLHIYTYLPFRTLPAYKPAELIHTEGLMLQPLSDIVAIGYAGNVMTTIGMIALHDYIEMDDFKELTWFVKNLLVRRMNSEIKWNQVQLFMARVFGFECQADLKAFSRLHHKQLVRNLRVKTGARSEFGETPDVQHYLNQPRVPRQPRNAKEK